MERVCEDGHDIEALTTKQKLFMARLHTTDISLILQQLVAACITQDSRNCSCMCECRCFLIVVIAVSACSQAMSSL